MQSHRQTADSRRHSVKLRIRPSCPPLGFVCRLLMIGLLPAACCLLLFPAPAPADVVYLKDGFALHGKVRSEANPEVDPLSGMMIPIRKGNCFIVDDRVRWVMFSPRIVQEPDP